jgi:hypothetical protein
MFSDDLHPLNKLRTTNLYADDLPSTTDMTGHWDANDSDSYGGTGTTWTNVAPSLSSPYNRNLTLHGGVSFASDVAIKFFVFDGTDDYIGATTGGYGSAWQVDHDNDFTVIVWVRSPLSWSSDENSNSAIFQTGDLGDAQEGSGYAYGTQMRWGSNTDGNGTTYTTHANLVIDYYTPPPELDSGFHSLKTPDSAIVTPGSWHMLSIVSNHDETARFYKDGLFLPHSDNTVDTLATEENIERDTSGFGNLSIGRSYLSDDYDYAANGTAVSIVWCWKRALKHSEIISAYNYKKSFFGI